MRKIIELPINKIITLYEQGVRVIDIAKQYHVSHTLIDKHLKDFYHQNKIERPKQRAGNPCNNLPMGEIITLYQNGTSIYQLAKLYKGKVSQSTIRNRLKEHDIIIRSNGTSKIEIPIDELKSLYQSGMTTSELKKHYNVSHGTIINRLNEYNSNKYSTADSKHNQEKIDILSQFRHQLLAIKKQKILKK